MGTEFDRGTFLNKYVVPHCITMGNEKINSMSVKLPF